MTLDELNATVATEADLSKAKASDAVRAVLHGIQDALQKGDKVSIAGFGVFEVVERAERQGRNPQTGQAITIPASKAVKFKPGKGLKTAVES